MRIVLQNARKITARAAHFNHHDGRPFSTVGLRVETDRNGTEEITIFFTSPDHEVESDALAAGVNGANVGAFLKSVS